MTTLVTFLLQLYRAGLSPLLGCRCRFTPSCSHYAEEALKQHGLCRGMALSMKRILRCNPFGGRGWDPVPFAGRSEATTSTIEVRSPSGA